MASVRFKLNLFKDEIDMIKKTPTGMIIFLMAIPYDN